MWGITTRFHLPARRTSHYLVEIPEWFVSFTEEGEDFAVDYELSRSDPILPPAGTTTRDRWNQAVIGPSLRFEVPLAPQIARLGDVISLVVPSFHSDRSNHISFSFADTAMTRLFRDGELIGESSRVFLTSFPVPAEAGDYRLEVQLVRDGGGPCRPSSIWPGPSARNRATRAACPSWPRASCRPSTTTTARGESSSSSRSRSRARSRHRPRASRACASTPPTIAG